MQNLASHTAHGTNWPPYFSVNECDGHVEITVRNHPRNGMCGDTATICVSREVYADIVRQMQESTAK